MTPVVARIFDIFSRSMKGVENRDFDAVFKLISDDCARCN